MIYQNPDYCMGNRSTWEKFQVAMGVLANPLMLLWDKIGLVKNPVYITTAADTDGHKRASMQLATRGGTTDINDAVVVLSGKEYPPKLLGILDEGYVSGKAPVVLDCGGHIGTFAMYVKSLAPEAEIFVMEPVPDNLQLQKANFARNNLSNITVIPYALYGASGTFYIDLAGKQFDAVNVTTEKPSHDQFVTIEALTLDQVVEQNNLSVIDLMKLDIEGAEYNVFQYSLASLNGHVRRIIMEFHPAGDKAKRDEIVNRLCAGEGQFELIYETKNILGFQNKSLP